MLAELGHRGLDYRRYTRFSGVLIFRADQSEAGIGPRKYDVSGYFLDNTIITAVTLPYNWQRINRPKNVLVCRDEING